MVTNLVTMEKINARNAGVRTEKIGGEERILSMSWSSVTNSCTPHFRNFIDAWEVCTPSDRILDITLIILDLVGLHPPLAGTV